MRGRGVGTRILPQRCQPRQYINSCGLFKPLRLCTRRNGKGHRDDGRIAVLKKEQETQAHYFKTGWKATFIEKDVYDRNTRSLKYCCRCQTQEISDDQKYDALKRSASFFYNDWYSEILWGNSEQQKWYLCISAWAPCTSALKDFQWNVTPRDGNGFWMYKILGKFFAKTTTYCCQGIWAFLCWCKWVRYFFFPLPGISAWIETVSMNWGP